MYSAVILCMLLICAASWQRCWCGYPSGARCKLFAYGPADATAIPKADYIQTGFTFLVPACPSCPGKEVVKRV